MLLLKKSKSTESFDAIICTLTCRKCVLFSTPSQSPMEISTEVQTFDRWLAERNYELLLVEQTVAVEPEEPKRARHYSEPKETQQKTEGNDC